MELSKKAIIGTAAGAIITVAVTSGVTWLITTSSAGVDAAERLRIERIVQDAMQLPDGKTYGAAISDLDKNVAVLTADVENIDENVDLIRQAVQAIASD